MIKVIYPIIEKTKSGEERLKFGLKIDKKIKRLSPKQIENLMEQLKEAKSKYDLRGYLGTTI